MSNLSYLIYAQCKPNMVTLEEVVHEITAKIEEAVASSSISFSSLLSAIVVICYESADSLTCKLNIFGFWTVHQPKQVIWRGHLRTFFTLYRQEISSITYFLSILTSHWMTKSVDQSDPLQLFYTYSQKNIITKLVLQVFVDDPKYSANWNFGLIVVREKSSRDQ